MGWRIVVGGLADSAGFRSVHSRRCAAANALDRMLWMPRIVLAFIGRQTCGRHPARRQSWPNPGRRRLSRGSPLDRVVAVIRRHVLAGQESSAWIALGRAAAATARITGQALLYCLRFALTAPATARGLRQMVLDAAPLPALRGTPAPEATGPSRTKKAVLLALYRAHPHYGNRGTASRVAAELAPQAGLQAGTARSYLYAELDGRPS